jgi:hypothetical protein
MLKIRWSTSDDPLPWVALICAIAALVGAMLSARAWLN